MSKEKVVLAYSGGLDTSVCVKWLQDEKNLDVVCVCGNVGQEETGLDAKKQKALDLGVLDCQVLDLRDEFSDEFLTKAIAANSMYENKYPLLSALSRPLLAKKLVEVAHEFGATYVAHGCTGKGNDQVRFDLTFQILAPEIEIITPTRDMILTREYEIDYLRKHGITADYKKMEYSINKGLWGTSIGGKETLHSEQTLPEEAYPSQITAEGEERLKLTFEQGELAAVNGTPYTDKVEAIRAVDEGTIPNCIFPEELGMVREFVAGAKG